MGAAEALGVAADDLMPAARQLVSRSLRNSRLQVYFGPFNMIEPRCGDRFLWRHAEVDHACNDPHLDLRLNMAALQPERGVGLALLRDHAGHESVYTTFVRADAVGMIFIDGKKIRTVLQYNPRLRFDDTRAEAHEVALDKRNQISIFVCRRDVFRIAIAYAFFHSRPSRGKHRGGRTQWYCLNFIGGSVNLNSHAHPVHAVTREKITYRDFHVVTVREVTIAIGKRQFLRFNHEMQRVGAVRVHRFEIKAFEDFEHLQRRKSLGGRRQFVYVITTVVGRNGFYPVRAMIGEIFECKKSVFFL